MDSIVWPRRNIRRHHGQVFFEQARVATTERLSTMLSMQGMMSSCQDRSSIGTTLFMTTTTTTSNDASSASAELRTQRVHNVNFVSPLLDYGYPPASRELELKQFRQQKGSAIDIDDVDDYVDEKPILLYLPGFDGTYFCPFIQYPELGTEFEVWCMTVGMDDRSTYLELKAAVLDFLTKECTNTDSDGPSFEKSGVPNNRTKLDNDQGTSSAVGGGIFAGWFRGNFLMKTEAGPKAKGRPVYLAGESFGGILASDIALTLLKKDGRSPSITTSSSVGESIGINLQGLVLINPATCYDRSQLAAKGPQVASMPNALYIFGLFTQLIPLFTDEYSVDQLLLILQAKVLPSVIDNPVREAYMGRVAFSLPTRLEFMPSSTLSWRLDEWLQAGSTLLRGASFKEYPQFRSLIVVGERDKTLPSIAEAERLATKVMLPSQVQIHVVEGAGHASTCGSRLDLAAVMRKRFPELQKMKPGRNQNTPQETKRNLEGKDNTKSSNSDGTTTTGPSSMTVSSHSKRTSMKPQAQEGIGPYFGMEDRYDRADFGLNPILYWSKDYYRKVKMITEERRILLPGTVVSTSYTKATYKVPNTK